MATYETIEGGQVFYLVRSRRYFEVESTRGDTVTGFYVDHTGKKITPPRMHTASFTRDFLDSYAKRWQLDGRA